MDRYVVAYVHPFVMEQEISIYENNKLISNFKCTLDQMEEMIYNLCAEGDIHKVIFKGGQLYALNFNDHLTAHKFGNHKINVEIYN